MWTRIILRLRCRLFGHNWQLQTSEEIGTTIENRQWPDIDPCKFSDVEVVLYKCTYKCMRCGQTDSREESGEEVR